MLVIIEGGIILAVSFKMWLNMACDDFFTLHLKFLALCTEA